MVRHLVGQISGEKRSHSGQHCCLDSSGNEHLDGRNPCIAAPITKEFYRGVFKDILHVMVKVISYWSADFPKNADASQGTKAV